MVGIWDDKRMLVGLLAGIGVGNFSIFSAPLYIGGLMDGYGFDEAAAGIIITLEIGSTALVCLLLPNRVAQIALRRAGIAGAVSVLLVNMATPWIDSFLAMAATRLIAGIGAGVTLAVASTIIARSAEPDRFYAIALAINALMMTVALVVMGYAKQAWLFDGYVYVFSGTLLLLLPFLWWLPSALAETHEPPKAANADGKNGGLLLGILGIVLLFNFSVMEGSIYTFSERSGMRLGLIESEIGMVLAGTQIFGLMGAAIPAVFGDRIPRLVSILIGTAIVSLSGALIYQVDSTIVYVWAILAYNTGFFLALPYLIGICALLDSNGVWAARASGASLLGSGVAPAIAGALVSSSGYESLGAMSLILGFIAVLMTIIFFTLSKRRGTVAGAVS